MRHVLGRDRCSDDICVPPDGLTLVPTHVDVAFGLSAPDDKSLPQNAGARRVPPRGRGYDVLCDVRRDVRL